MRKAVVLALAGVLLLAIAGPALAGTVTPADVDLRFRTQIENDFEWRDNYTFDDDKDELADTRNGWFAESEIRIGFDGKAGNWMTHVLLESEQIWDRNNEGQGRGGTSLDIERAWADYNFGPFHLRAGLSEAIVIDPANVVYQDDDPMARLWGKFNEIDWTVGWMRRQDDASTTVGESRSFDHDVFFGKAVIPIDTGMGKIEFTPFIMYSRDRSVGGNAYDEAVSGDKNRTDQYWIGGAIQGPVGPVQVLAQGVYLTGEDEAGANTQQAGVTVDINAWMALLDVAWPIPNTPITIEAGFVLASGDDDPFDKDATGYAAIAQDSELFNGEGIWLDDDVDVFADEAIVGAGVNQRVRLTFDDRFTPAFDGTFGFPGAITLTANQSEHLVMSHPGIQFYALLIHYKATPELTISGIFNHVRTFETVDNVSDTTGALTGIKASAGEIGNELALKAVWKPEKYVTFTPQISVFIPGEVVDDITGEQDTAVNFMTEMLVSF